MICYAPWHALSIRFNGDVVPDCVYTGRHGNLLRDTLPEIFSNIGLQKTKDSILKGILPLECQQCVKKEKAVGHSRRIFFEKELNPLIKSFDPNKTDIVFLEFNMSNKCNLKCRMCSGVNSTAWIKEDLKLSTNPHFKRPINHPDFGYKNLSEEIVDKLFEYPEYFKNLQYVNIKGGEPYMEPANKKILEYLIRFDLAKNITLDISTNGTIIDKEFDTLALKFKNTKWHVSLEGTGKLYEYIRGDNAFSFEEFEFNLKEFKKFHNVVLAGTVMTYNVCHLEEIKIWFNNIKEQNFNLVLNNVVVAPEYLNPCLLPDRILANTGYYHDPKLSNQLTAFVEFTKELDKIRNTNVLNVCPELESLFL